MVYSAMVPRVTDTLFRLEYKYKYIQVDIFIFIRVHQKWANMTINSIIWTDICECKDKYKYHDKQHKNWSMDIKAIQV